MAIVGFSLFYQNRYLARGVITGEAESQV